MNEIPTKKTLITNLSQVEGWLSSHEALLLYELAKSVPADGEIVEIGSFKGKSTIALAAGHIKSGKKGMVWAVDPHEGIIKKSNGPTHGLTLQAFQKNIRNASIQDQVHPLVTTSKKAAKDWKLPIRLLFLDGLHDFEHTHDDYQAWSPYVMNSGVIAFHDGFCGEEGVWNVINGYVFKRKNIVDIGTAGSILYIIFGTPTFFSKRRVSRKIKWIRFATKFNKKHFSWSIKKMVIHRIVRLFLLTHYTREIYKQ